MARTTATIVKQVIKTSLSDTQVGEVIEFANRMVTDILGSAGYSAAKLKDIETFLTAHIIRTTKERLTVEERVADVWVKYAQRPSGYLEQTEYGQTIIFMDSEGLMLQSANEKSSFEAINQVDRP